MAIKVCSLGSGSKGNSVLIDNGRSRILIDAGLPARTLLTRLEDINVGLNQLDGVLITHEHNDHINALETVARSVPVYAHDYTMQAILAKCFISLKNQMNFSGECFSIGTFDITAFKVSHDAVYPLGYTISDSDSKITYATDLGYCSKEFLRAAKGSGLVVIESNHDVDMLMNGRYPAYLKRRIISNKGHLSNLACAVAINELASQGTKKFVLGHLSENNNLPELAYWTNADYLRGKGADIGREIKLVVAEQRCVSGFIGCD
ncbi:MAG: MBL fold metallo-hydrolase [Clostridia bacterium]|nr:MBL fold metallo-hydrolase [Clostridia bacterium]